ncbi:polysaccharide synthesis protein GtrA [Bifidobacterium sp. DSM 109960]|uniref:Polysaccharide synthesis protein GtrA n=2 Tax=Bifidobacterium erythrocebi TaxID=2675325 RepID=A0A7Y0ETB5_9BIFI|nr:polysaccharide synthesis protein GtrA [Bifidobacterium sp. DSM 109960]
MSGNEHEQHTDDNGHEQRQKPQRRTLLPYLMVSATQTLVEFGSFTILHLISVPSAAANAVAIVLSASYNFLMNRNVTFKSSSNFTRSVALFIALWLWNYLFGSTMLTWLPKTLEWNPILVKFLTMGCQFAWGYPLCKHVIFR